jgi:acyl phosphate:glycerol-3-phosphate acyltransferase
MIAVIAIVAAYLVGSIPCGVIVGKLAGFDPRAVGSGNIGMTNVARAGGFKAALATFIGDVLKGAVPVAAVRAIGFGPEVIAWTGIAAFVGAICSVFLGFRGGKGVSAALGVWIAIAPLAALFAIAAFGIVFGATRVVSLASMSAAIVLPPAVAVLALPRPFLLLAIVMTALVLLRHQPNIRRLIAGEEPRFEPGKKKDETA